MKHTTAIFKIGGKILEDFENLNTTISQLTQIFDENLIQKIILIPGGGTLANFIRKVYSELKFTEEIAHWMGTISMNYNGLELSKKFPKLEVIEDFDRLKKINKSFCIFLPYQFLKENDKLPHSWDVTSDSITLFLAKELGFHECFLIKDVDGILNNENQVIKEISASEFKKLKEIGKIAKSKFDSEKLKEMSKPIDPYLTNLIQLYNIPCIILNGSKNTTRILKYFKSTKPEEKLYTKII
ncbi:MAG: hypothetical protein JSV23_05645 [Promethearchaeota archaeon]|nr:MAG: hypothetical protein JSV23_05645 [Candidatus Lokiarchaeota archaeon]